MGTLFPVYPAGIKMINYSIGIETKGGTVKYFNADGPIYQHDLNDYQSFRYITSQMIELKTVRQVDIISFFQVSKESVIRWQKIYREKGARGFFGTKKVTKRGNVLTKEVLPKVQELLNQGKALKEIGEEFSIKPDTLQKGIQYGRLTRPVTVVGPSVSSNGKTQSERSKQDIIATLGVGCTNETGRIEAIKKK